MVGHGGSSVGSYLTDPTSPIPSHCASIVTTSTVRVKVITLLTRFLLRGRGKISHHRDTTKWGDTTPFMISWREVKMPTLKTRFIIEWSVQETWKEIRIHLVVIQVMLNNVARWAQRSERYMSPRSLILRQRRLFRSVLQSMLFLLD